MPVKGMMVLAPNYIGFQLANSGIEGISANFGYGVAEATKANAEAELAHEKSANPAMDSLRRAKAREFGMTKEQVGF